MARLTDELSVVCVGLEEKSSLIIRSMAKLYSKDLKTTWRVCDDVSAEAVANMMVDVDATVIVVDVDSEAGRRAWYVLQALQGSSLLVAVTEQANQGQADFVIAKPFRPKDFLPVLNAIGKDG